jgi:carboxymethylenebutenolidase
MCDEDTAQETEIHLQQKDASGLSRRKFTTLGAGAVLSAVLPQAANAVAVDEHEVTVPTPDGPADCYFVHPSSGRHAGVLIWPDILGLRPAFRLMGKRLAESGYAVLVVNPYFRSSKAPVVNPGDSFRTPEVRNKVLPFARQLSATTHTSDAKAFVTWIDKQKAVNRKRKIGTMGYCMGGPIVMRTAAAVPRRIGAAASFHGGGLVTDKPDSPHLLIPEMKASFLIAIAANDDERDPKAKDVLRKTYDKNRLAAEIEVYDGAMHGWCPPDSAVYNQAQAERAWNRLHALFDKALA